MRISSASLVLVCLSALIAATGPATAAVVYSNNFDADAAGITGTFTRESVQNFSGVGPAGNQFGGSFLHNASGGNPSGLTTLVLTNLPTHDAISLDFLLGIIDSWDGIGSGNGPDSFNVRLDGNTVFSHVFAIASGTSNYAPPPGVFISQGSYGFNSSWSDQAYNMYNEPTLQLIPHSASTATIDFFASGSGWQGGTDESWAVDNLSISITPEPGGCFLVALPLLTQISRRRMR